MLNLVEIDWSALAVLAAIMLGVAALAAAITLLAVWPRIRRLQRALGFARARMKLLEDAVIRAGGDPRKISHELPPDDLAAIRGIGPKLAEQLNALGIHRYGDLANLDERGVARLEAQLGGIPGRIERDRWPEQARALMAADRGRMTNTGANGRGHVRG